MRLTRAQLKELLDCTEEDLDEAAQDGLLDEGAVDIARARAVDPRLQKPFLIET
jgi:hypothetical protein